MSKKTKKEKIIAQYRRKVKLLSQLIEQKESIPSMTNTFPDKKEIEQKKLPRTLHKESKMQIKSEFLNKNLINYFKVDLKKSFLISFFIIALEFFIYFVMIKK